MRAYMGVCVFCIVCVDVLMCFWLMVIQMIVSLLFLCTLMLCVSLPPDSIVMCLKSFAFLLIQVLMCINVLVLCCVGCPAVI